LSGAPGMDVMLSVVAAIVSSVFAIELARSAVERPRLYAQVWAVAMALYAGATWALVFGLAFGWSAFGFKVFYLLGAIANIPLLAAGSVALVVGDAWGRRFAKFVAGFVLLGTVAVAIAPLESSVQGVGIPEGSELFDFVIHIGSLSVPGPRVFAIAAGAVGTVVLVGFALVSALRAWSSNRQLALGNMLIVGGAVAPAVGGSMTAVGEGAALALSLAVGAVMLYSGYRVAVAARRKAGVA
jgi:hypothetical protein